MAVDHTAPPAAGLFSGVTFVVFQSDKLSSEQAAEVIQNLESHGAVFRALATAGDSVDLTDLSHIMSSSADFPQYDEAIDLGCHVVKPSWVEQSIVKGRQAQARQHSPDPALIFQSVIVTYGDLPEGDRDAITAGVMAMGGMYSPGLTKLVTHIVSLSEESEKIRVIRTMNLSAKVVLPHWFDDCLRLGKMISEAPYILPNPQILDSASFSNRVLANEPDIGDAKSAVAGNPPRLTPPATPKEPAVSRKRMDVFKQKRLFFCPDLNVHAKLSQTLSELVESCGGTITEDVTKCDVFIGHYRDGSSYRTASRAGKTVGNLPWFYSVMLRNRWRNPLDKLLHYPVPRHGIPNFSGMRISLSNYTGDARVYLENLIAEAGATFTKTMKQDNTHLITAHQNSEKCEAAQEWNIPVINHLWLEESYAKCQAQSLTHARYTHFPSHTNLSEIVGQTKIDLERVEQAHFADQESPMVGIPSRPSPRKTVRAADVVVAQNCATGKENESPSVARASKVRAVAELERAMDDIAKFDKERKRKGGVTHSKQRPGAVDESNDLEESADEDSTVRPSKKLKKDEGHTLEPTLVQYKLLVTGDNRWKGKVGKEANDKKALRALGIQLVDNPLQCNLLCAPKILRTRKFVAALASAPEVVSTEFLDHTLKQSALKTPSSYRLQDPENEAKYGFNLQEAVERAAINQRRLLHGWTIYITEHVTGDFDTFKDIVKANGGTAILYKGRAGVQPPRRRLLPNEDPDAGPESAHQGTDDEVDHAYLVSSTEDDDVKVWSAFRKLVEKQGLTPRIVKTDWLLNLALAQTVEWDERWELSEDLL